MRKDVRILLVGERESCVSVFYTRVTEIEPTYFTRESWYHLKREWAGWVGSERDGTGLVGTRGGVNDS